MQGTNGAKYATRMQIGAGDDYFHASAYQTNLYCVSDTECEDRGAGKEGRGHYEGEEHKIDQLQAADEPTLPCTFSLSLMSTRVRECGRLDGTTCEAPNSRIGRLSGRQ